jgi:CRP-like cAMP-binding protein
MANVYSLAAEPQMATLTMPKRTILAGERARSFNLKTFLTQPGDGRTILQRVKGQTLYAQGDAATAAFYILEGRVKLTVISPQGKEAVVAILESGDFFGEACLAGQRTCIDTASPLGASRIMRIDRISMCSTLHNEPAFSELFMSHLLTRNMRIQEDLVDQFFNSAEKRLARTLLLLARCGKEGEPEQVIPKLSQETLAEMVGTTRSRVSFFLNRFKKLGYIECNAGLRVHKSLLNVSLS